MFFLIVKDGILRYGKMKDIPVTRELTDFVKDSRKVKGGKVGQKSQLEEDNSVDLKLKSD